ncbi:MAG: conjugal transfer protein TraF [Proteobacteria bacterium]|nr:conjugal transfer protein TraF [Pseudomonadota bacterium]
MKPFTQITKIMQKLKYAFLILITICSITPLYANVAADQINAIMGENAKNISSNQLTHSTVKDTAKVPKTIKDLQNDYYFVFFYRSTCPHCHKFAPTLKDFANYYHIKIKAYSTDGGDLDGLHGKQMTADDYRQYFLQGGFKPVVPALYLQNKYTDQVYPVLFGEAQPFELAQRVNELMTHIEEQTHA